MNTSRHLIASAMLAAGILLTHKPPAAPQNGGPGLLSGLDIPYSTWQWQGCDISSNLNHKELTYNSIKGVMARSYIDRRGGRLMLLVLDAANFHNPKICLGALGYRIKELPNVEFETPAASISANAVYFYKGNAGRLVIYWMCIDKKRVDWLGQKIKELTISLFNKEKMGVMVRLDIPTTEAGVGDSIILARDFITSISRGMDPEDAEYVFGRP